LLASLLFDSFSNRRLPSSQLSPIMAPPQPIVVLEPLPWTRSTVMPFALNELVNGGLLAPTGDGPYPAWMVPSASDRESNPPYGYVVSFIRTSAASPPRRAASCGVVLPLRSGAPQLHPQRHIAGSHLCRHLRGVPGDPSELGSLGAPVPRGGAHPCFGRDAGAMGGPHRQLDVRTAGDVQGVVPTVHDDVEQRGLGEGVVLPPQRWCRPPSYHRWIVPLMERELRIFEKSLRPTPCRWRARDCCKSASSRSTRPPGRGTRLASSRCRTGTTTSGRS
jgi:hypothetical protein